MKRWLAWSIPIVAVALIGGLAARSIQARKAERAVMATPPKATGLDLAPGDVTVARVQDLVRTVEVSGGLKAVDSAFLKAKVAAEVKTLLVREGDTVKAGQLIGQLDTVELDLRLNQAEQTAVASRAQLDITRRALDNNRALVAQGFISSTGLETSVSNDAAAQASYGAANAAAGLARKSRADAQLLAPIGGMVSQRLVQPGERVSVDTRILEIVDLSRIEVEAPMAPEDIGELRVGQAARLQVDGLAQPVAAKVARISPSTQAGTRAVMVYLALQPQPGLRQGLFAKGQVELQRRRTLAVPVSAVRVDQAQPYVQLVVDGQTVQKTVTLGDRGELASAPPSGEREAMVEIVNATASGIPEGSTVLRGTVGVLRDGTAVRLAPNSAPGAAPAAEAAASGTSAAASAIAAR